MARNTTRPSSPYRWIVAERRPVRTLGALWFAQREWRSFEAVNLPLGKDGATVDMILSRTVIVA